MDKAPVEIDEFPENEQPGVINYEGGEEADELTLHELLTLLEGRQQ